MKRHRFFSSLGRASGGKPVTQIVVIPAICEADLYATRCSSSANRFPA
eukprot:CAMPEP_0195110640 /NCGR_PEP_ID=MMETSP0448-20130528/93448_1 /TAXON_ID=66468 /ORGANISM="Heterocapsa triquestra, Strain CCMP 448" /LENGTH=47 /DNA_ID= /DNA_START= /DNA_END= /DNA_ORIENTATION=